MKAVDAEKILIDLIANLESAEKLLDGFFSAQFPPLTVVMVRSPAINAGTVGYIDSFGDCPAAYATIRTNVNAWRNVRMDCLVRVPSRVKWPKWMQDGDKQQGWGLR